MRATATAAEAPPPRSRRMVRRGLLAICLLELAQAVPVRVPQEQVVGFYAHLYSAKRGRNDERRVALDDDLQALDPERFLVVERQGGVREHDTTVLH